MELLLPGFVVPLLSGNERRHKVRFSSSSWISVVVGSELTETFCAAACKYPTATFTRVQEANSGNLGSGNPAAAVVPPGIVHVASRLSRIHGTLWLLPESGTVAATKTPTTNEVVPPTEFRKWPQADRGGGVRMLQP